MGLTKPIEQYLFSNLLTKIHVVVYLKDIIRGDIVMDKAILQELVQGMVEIIKSDIVKVILYGSVARGTNDEESDVDIMIIIKNELDSFAEDKLSDFIVDMNLKYDKVFSVIDVNVHKFDKWAAVLPLYQNVDREGIVLWTAA